MNNSSDLCPTETPSLQDIDLSNNFLSSIPTALKGISALKKLSLSANLIQVIQKSPDAPDTHKPAVHSAPQHPPTLHMFTARKIC